jgi:hypothetical protein
MILLSWVLQQNSMMMVTFIFQMTSLGGLSTLMKLVSHLMVVEAEVVDQRLYFSIQSWRSWEGDRRKVLLQQQ